MYVFVCLSVSLMCIIPKKFLKIQLDTVCKRTKSQHDNTANQAPGQFFKRRPVAHTLEGSDATPSLTPTVTAECKSGDSDSLVISG